MVYLQVFLILSLILANHFERISYHKCAILIKLCNNGAQVNTLPLIKLSRSHVTCWIHSYRGCFPPNLLNIDELFNRITWPSRSTPTPSTWASRQCILTQTTKTRTLSHPHPSQMN